MPKTYSVAERARITKAVVAGLRNGTPLTVLCDEDGMPCDDTIRTWADGDPELAREIARARDVGFDHIAHGCIAIADDKGEDPSSRKLRIWTRLELLKRWDPKRYGDRQLVGSDPDNPLPTGISVHFVKTDGAEDPIS